MDEVDLKAEREEWEAKRELISSLGLSGYVFFEEARTLPTQTTKRWLVTSKGNLTRLGEIRYYPQWRRYVFFPAQFIVLDSNCLRDIGEFLDAHKEDRK